MAEYEWKDMREALINILRKTKNYDSGPHNETCFLTAYQLAVLLYKDNRQLVRDSNCPQNIGGKGEQTSLTQHIANLLSRDMKPGGELEHKIELRFLCTEGLNQFSFLDEKGIIRQPSSDRFSMFRYIGE